jgi:hypothetical protein
MIDSDIRHFADMLDSVSEYYDKKPASVPVCKLYFASLINFDLDQVSAAITKHIESPEHGAFMPKVGCLIRQLSGATTSPDMIIAAAKLKKTPLGILARIHIGTWDLNNLGSFDLRQRAIECQDLLGEWKERAAKGEYSGHELSMMIKLGVDPASPFASGIAGPTDKRALTTRIQKLTGNTRHEFLLGNDNETPSDESVDLEQQRLIFKKIRGALDTPKVDKPKPDMSEPK